MSVTTYPLAFPTVGGGATGIVDITITPVSLVGLTESTFSLAGQGQVWPGQRWQLEMNLPQMIKAKGEQWASWITALNWKEGCFLAGDSANKSPRGVGTGTPVVNGSGQSGYNLVTRGWTASTPGILLKGDWIQLGTGYSARLYKVMFDVNSDSSGNATLTIWPQLRTQPNDGDAITIAPAQGRFMLGGTKRPTWSIKGAAHIYTFSTITAYEDLRP